ncbi:DDE-type integrase/transposase/recombinase [bacterium]|nr:DDE-type integrase/transposase/recombinase [bacterium]
MKQGESLTALFRYQVVSLVLSRILSGKPRVDAIREAASMAHAFFNKKPRYVSVRTIYHWLSKYEKNGITGLETVSQKKESILPKKFIAFIEEQKNLDPVVSIPELIKRAKVLNIIASDQKVDRSTVYRTCKRSGISVTRRRQGKNRDSRRFEYPHRMDMVLCDGKHFRAGAKRAKRVALFFLDDHSRFVLNVIVGKSESSVLFLHVLFGLIKRYGTQSIIYLDHGSGFIAKDTVLVLKNLGILLIHGKEKYPEGHGKIEKFNQTVKSAVLRGYDGRPDIDPDCTALEIRLKHYVQKIYNHGHHESIQETPYNRFYNDEKELLFPKDIDSLKRQFVVHARRRVTNDHIVSIDSANYEMPRGYAGGHVYIERHILENNKLFFLHKNNRIELKEVDLEANAKSRRAKNIKEEIVNPVPGSAADLAFEKDYRPVVDSYGGLKEEK